jgi:hypothetical protein
MNNKQKLVLKLFPYHKHIISPIDMAIGVSDGSGGRPLTAFKDKCILCDIEFIHITRSSIEMLATHKQEDVFCWLTENKNEPADTDVS